MTSKRSGTGQSPPDGVAYDEQSRQDRLDDYFKRSAERQDKLLEFVVSTLCKVNVGAIIALLSFMGLRLANGELPIDVKPLICFWLSFMLAFFIPIFSYSQIRYVDEHLYNMDKFARGAIDKKPDDPHLVANFLDWMTYALIAASIGMAVLGSYSFWRYLDHLPQGQTLTASTNHQLTPAQFVDLPSHPTHAAKAPPPNQSVGKKP